MELGRARLRVEVDAAGARSGVEDATRAFDILKRKGQDAVSGVKSSFSSFIDTIFSMKGALAGLGIGVLANSFINAGRETENYMIRLRVLLGSVEEGNRLFKEMNDYAARTPFEFRDIMGAATQLSGVLKGGVSEITGYMPLIADLAAASGLGIQETTGQVVRMLSAGASAADRFREIGINSMLGFQTGVQYSAEQTREILIKAWESPTSKFRDAANLLVNTWDGAMSNLQDAWFQFQQRVMIDGGLIEYVKALVQTITDEFQAGFGKTTDSAHGFSQFLISALEVGTQAIGYMIGALKGLAVAIELGKTATSGLAILWAGVRKEAGEASAFMARANAEQAKRTYETMQQSMFATESSVAEAKERYVKALQEEVAANEAAATSTQLYITAAEDNQATIDSLFKSISEYSSNVDFTAFLDKVKERFEANKTAATGANEANTGFASGLLNFAGPAGSAATGVDKLTAAQRRQIQAQKEFSTDLTNLQTTYDKVYGVEERRRKALDLLNEGVNRGIISGKQYQIILQAINAEYADGLKDADKYQKSLDDIKDSYIEGHAALTRRNKAAETAHDLNQRGLLVGKEYAAVLEGINKEYINSANSAGKASQATDEYAKTLENAARGIQSAFTDFFYNIFDKGIKSFGDLKDGIIDTFKKMLAEMATLAIARPIIMPIMQFAGSMLGGGTNYGQMLSSFFGGSSNGGVMQALMGGNSASAAGGASTMDSLFSQSSWISAGRNLYNGFMGTAQRLWSGNAGVGYYGPTPDGGNVASGSNFMGTGGANGFAPSTAGYAAAGIAGLYAGYNRWQNSEGGLAGGLGAATYGLAGYGASMGLASMAAGSGFGAGVTAAGSSLGLSSAAIPVVGWIVAIAAVVDMISGGKLFGTKFKPDEATATLQLAAEGATATSSLTEVRNRSLFRGRQWRTTEIAPGEEAIEAASALWAAVDKVMTDSARALKGTAPEMLSAAFRTVQDFDKKGRATTTKFFVDVLGRSWEEATTEAAITRINAEAIIKTIDSVLGTTVTQTVTNVTERAIAGFSELDLSGLEGLSQVQESVSTTSTIVSEASSIAERWRSDAERLMEGATFLLAASADIRTGFNLLGEGGTLTRITELVEDMQRGEESLSDTYSRLAQSTKFYQGLLDMLQVSTERTGETFVEFAVDLVDAAGSMERASQLYNSFLSGYFTAEERRQLQVRQATESVTREVADLGELGEGVTFDTFKDRFLEVMDTLSADELVQWLEAGEALKQFNDLMQEIGETALDAQAALDAYSSVFSDFEERLATQGKTQTQLLRESLDVMLNLANEYDGSAQSQRELFGALDQRYQMELNYLSLIKQAQDEINSTLDSSIERIRLSQMTEEDQYAYFKEQADALAASLAGLTDPEQITDTVNRINELQNRAWGVLTEDQQASMADGFVTFLEGVRELANERLEEATDEVQTQNDTIGSAVSAALDRFTVETASSSSALTTAAQALQAAAETTTIQQAAAAAQQIEAANTMLAAASVLANSTVRVVLVNQQSEVGY